MLSSKEIVPFVNNIITLTNAGKLTWCRNERKVSTDSISYVEYTGVIPEGTLLVRNTNTNNHTLRINDILLYNDNDNRMNIGGINDLVTYHPIAHLFNVIEHKTTMSIGFVSDMLSRIEKIAQEV